MELMKKLWREEEGQGVAEYAIVLGGVALAVVGILVLFSEELEGIFERITTAIAEGIQD